MSRLDEDSAGTWLNDLGFEMELLGNRVLKLGPAGRRGDGRTSPLEENRHVGCAAGPAKESD